MRLVEHPEYRRLCGLGTASGVMPICWPFIEAAALHKAALADPDFPHPALGLVHLSQEMAWLRPPELDVPVECRVIAGRTMPAHRGLDLELETVFLQRGKEIWRARSVIWCRRGPGGGSRRDRPSPLEALEASTHSISERLPEDLGRRFARIAGDRNPIHQHALLARPFGFKRAIIHGMWTVARALGELERANGRPVREVSARFVSPVFIPGTIEIRHGLANREAHVVEVFQDGHLCVQLFAASSPPTSHAR